MISRLTLLLSARCNLSCSYCYQGERRGPERMTWDTARAALDFCLARRAVNFSVEFNGGEPLLEPDLLRRCIEYLESGGGPAPVRFFLTTNGTLLTSQLLAFLAAHDVGLQISMDGVPSAQRRRGDWTSARLGRVLDELARTHGPYMHRRLRISAGLVPDRLDSMADSGRHFLKLGAREILFYTILGQGERWTRENEEVLIKQVGILLEEGVAHWERTGEIPFIFLRAVEERGQSDAGDGPFCSAGSGTGLCVDTAGRGWSCIMFASSLQPLTPMAREASRAADLGDVLKPDLEERMASAAAGASMVRLLTNRGVKYSSHGLCRDCEFLGACFLCPAVISHSPGNRDPDRVPDFFCAFTRATGNARREFHERTAGQLKTGALDGTRVALVQLHEALTRSLKH